MIDKEIAELRRRLNPDKNNIATLRGRYVNSQRETIHEFTESFALLPMEEIEKYLAIFRRAMSGTNGKNLIDAAFSIPQVESGKEHGLLTKLRDSRLRDDEAAKEFFDAAASGINIEGNALILLMVDTYDVPKKHRDDGDAGESEQMFTYIMCAVCPVKEAKSTLSYDAAKKAFHTRSCEWNVSAPELGFLFPAFDSRQTNIYNALYYVKNPADNCQSFADRVFGAELPLPADEQKEIFGASLSHALAEECTLEVVQAIHDDIAQRIEEHKTLAIAEPLTITRTDIAAVLESCEISEDKIADLKGRLDSEYGDLAELLPRNLVNPKQFEVKTPDVSIKVNPERGDLVETRVIDGVKYVLVRADSGVTVNGIDIEIK
ncbi:MAG: DUF4317 domain-containing protein [Ruminococcaceae bacterium]|nr:DUF4317 domain-containing protein [Oscillospiraceae bacterium]